MTTTTYETVLRQVRQLPLEEQHRLVEEITRAEQPMNAEPKHSIRELRGLGKEVWTAIDVETYIETERNSWDG